MLLYQSEVSFHSSAALAGPPSGSALGAPPLFKGPWAACFGDHSCRGLVSRDRWDRLVRADSLASRQDLPGPRMELGKTAKRRDLQNGPVRPGARPLCARG